MIGALWRGEIGLARTFWLYGWFGAFLLKLPSFLLELTYPWFRIMTAAETPGFGMLQIYVISSWIPFGWILFMLVPIWRSASNYQGPLRWAVLAKVSVGLSALLVLLRIIQLGG
ncbi:MAG: hypothetical protein ACE5Q3_02450 [Alphaproteobacteria bacterium]